MLCYLNGDFNEKKTGLMLYALQMASCNLKHLQTETPQPSQVVIDLPKRTEPRGPMPGPAPALGKPDTYCPLRVPEPGSAEDDYQEDVLRQAREVREELAFQIPGEQTESAGKKNARKETAKETKQETKTGKATEPSSRSSSNDRLPPGTIQACVSSPRRERRTRYVN